MSLLTEKQIAAGSLPVLPLARRSFFEVAWPFCEMSKPERAAAAFRLIVHGDDGQPIAINTTGAHYLDLFVSLGLELWTEGVGLPACSCEDTLDLPILDNVFGPDVREGAFEYVHGPVVSKLQEGTNHLELTKDEQAEDPYYPAVKAGLALARANRAFSWAG